MNDDYLPDDFYTLASGDDLNTGLSPNAPVRTLQSIFDRYQVGPHDLIVLDTGDYSTLATITQDDEGLLMRELL